MAICAYLYDFIRSRRQRYCILIIMGHASKSGHHGQGNFALHGIYMISPHIWSICRNAPLPTPNHIGQESKMPKGGSKFKKESFIYLIFAVSNGIVNCRQASTDGLSRSDTESVGSCPDGSRSAAHVEPRFVGKAGNWAPAPCALNGHEIAALSSGWLTILFLFCSIFCFTALTLNLPWTAQESWRPPIVALSSLISWSIVLYPCQ